MQAETLPPILLVSEISLSISAYCSLFIKNPLPPCGMICACGYTTQSFNAKCVNPALRRFKFWRFFKPILTCTGICITAHSAWVFQGRGGQATASVKTGPATARVDEPARGCLRLNQRDNLVREIIYTNCKRSARPRIFRIKQT